MINLIPPAAQLQVKREYWLRVVIVWLFLLGTAGVIIAVLKIPTYALVHNQLSIFADSYETASEDSLVFKESEAAVKKANATAKLLQSGVPVTFSELVTELHSIANESISIETVVLARAEEGVAPIVVGGKSLTRASLAQFNSDLEKSDYFMTAVLPIANLAKDKDISFTITLTPADLTQTKS